MPRSKKPIQPNQRELLAKIPAEATRVKVETELGKKKFKAIDEVATSDIILTTKNGMPIVMKNTPGRKRKPDLKPANDAVAETMVKKAEAIANDDVLRMTREAPESPDVLHQVMVGMADEAASLGFERVEAERKGEGTSQISMRRVNALKGVADTWLRRKEQIVNHSVDLDGVGFGVVAKFFMETFRGSMEDSGVHSDMIKVVFAKFSQLVGSDEWKVEAKARMRKNL